jgi:hypothetical protein
MSATDATDATDAASSVRRCAVAEAGRSRHA